MCRFFIVVALASSGLLSLAFLAISAPLLAVMRADHRARRSREYDLEPLGYDDNDPGTDVDAEYCAHMRENAPGSCARCEGT